MSRNATSRESLGARIRFARRSAGLSHDRLGAIVGTSRQHLIRLEKDIHRPRLEMLEKIAAATDRPLEFFASEDGGSPDDEDDSDPVAALVAAIQGLVRAEAKKVVS